MAEKPRAGVFVDVQNIYYTTQNVFGRKFNYRALWSKLDAEFDIVTAYAYAIDRGDPQQQKFQGALGHIGFEVKLKPWIKRADGSAKGDWDVGITIDVLEEARHLDAVILLSGDGDFDLLINRVKERFNITAEVYGVREMTASSLINAASLYHPITEALLLES